MTVDPTWKLRQASKDRAEERGSEIAAAYGLVATPIDPFSVIDAERQLIHAEGGDFGDHLDGRLKYIGPRFLLTYNTRYNQWTHRGAHHPKVRFTVAHELGHYFIEEHRRFLVLRRQSHGSITEFQSPQLVEQQADRFAVGLLLPRKLVRSHVNQESAPDLGSIKQLAQSFDVSMTSAMVRWIEMSDFPCGVASISDGRVAWGSVSEGFRRVGAFKLRRGEKIRSGDATRFVREDVSVSRYREGQGSGFVHHWIDWDGARANVAEHYAAIPYSRSVLVLFCADEDELPDSSYEQDDDW